MQNATNVVPKFKDSVLSEVWYLHNLARAMSEVLTAKESSMGSSGGTTEVKIKVHSRKSLYRFLLGSLVPWKEEQRYAI